MASIAYRRDIDGLRAVAVLMVVFHHLHVPGFGGGYIGVDVFFVISGYLIGSILLQEFQRTGQIHFNQFYMRRVRRILPALLTTIIGSFILAYFFLQPDELMNFSKSAFATLLFASNFWFLAESQHYFAAQNSGWLLLHTWSLAVEEQYYLLFPLILMIVGRSAQRRIPHVFLCLTLFLLVLAQWQTATDENTAFYMLHARMWELLIGALLSMHTPPLIRQPWIAELLASVGCIVLAASCYFYSAYTSFPGISAMAPCLATAMFIEAGRSHNTLVTRVFKLPFMVGVGLISYSLYLWHWPLLQIAVYFHERLLTASESWIYLVICLLFATVSWKWIEKPFRHSEAMNSKTCLVILFTLIILIAVVLGLSLSAKGWTHRIPGPAYSSDDAHREYRLNTCFLIEGGFESLAPECTQVKAGQKNILVWGDSLAAQYFPGLQKTMQKAGISVSQYTKAACPAILSWEPKGVKHCISFHRQVMEKINENLFDIVLITSNFTNSNGLGREDYLQGFYRTLQQISRSRARIIVIGPGPTFNKEIYKTLGARTFFGDWLSRSMGFIPSRQVITNPAVFAMDQALRDLLRDPRFEYVSVAAALCDGAACRYQMDKELLVFDKIHLTQKGSEWIGQNLLMPAILKQGSAGR